MRTESNHNTLYTKNKKTLLGNTTDRIHKRSHAMQAQINLITILTDHIDAMTAFYQEVLGFKIEHEHGGYTEFVQTGVRFALCTRSIMAETTHHPSYNQARQGQVFELAFPLSNRQEVDSTYEEIISKGAIAIQSPAAMPWNQYTAFFADPDG